MLRQRDKSSGTRNLDREILRLRIWRRHAFCNRGFMPGELIYEAGEAIIKAVADVFIRYQLPFTVMKRINAGFRMGVEVFAAYPGYEWGP